MNDKLESQFSAMGSRSRSYGWHIEQYGDKLRAKPTAEQKAFFDKYGPRLEKPRQIAADTRNKCSSIARMEWVLRPDAR